MKITKLILNKYKRLLPGGIKYFEMEVLSNTVCIIGGNGCGKSSILTELTPLPSTSTDFEVGGYKAIYIEHNGSEYIIESRFGKNKGTHTFIKDTIELNESNNSIIQTQLCESEFGLTPIIKTLISGVVPICSMSKSNRKPLLLSCYPSDLLFILKHHKRILSELKGIRSNIKMLNVRKLELEDNIIPDETHSNMKLSMQTLIDLRNDVSNHITKYENSMDILRGDHRYNPYLNSLDIDTQQLALRQVKERGVVLRNSHPHLFKMNCGEERIKLTTSRSHLTRDMDNLNESIYALTSEINKFERMSSEMSEERITSIKKSILVCTDQIAEITVNTELPVISTDILNSLDIERIHDHLSLIHSTESNHILSHDEYVDKTYVWKSTVSRHNSLDTESSRIAESITLNTNRLGRVSKSKFRLNCVLECPAREASDFNVSSLEDELAISEESLHICSEEKVELEKEISSLTELLDASKASRPSIEYIVNTIKVLQIENLVAPTSSIIDVLKTNTSIVFNTISTIIDNTIAANKLKEVTTLLQTHNTELSTIMETREDTLSIMAESIDSKQALLTTLNKSHGELVSKMAEMNNDLTALTDIEQVSTTVGAIATSLEQYLIPNILNNKLKVLESVVRDLRTYQAIVDEEQVSIKTILREQESITIRLNEEILPTLINLTEEHDKLEVLENAIVNIPKEHMVTFINNVIAHTNTIIEQVWIYDMELKPLNSADTLTYALPVKMFNGTTLKDLTVSKGQGEIIDLSFTLALYISMSLGSAYPIILDEVDGGLSTTHRGNLLGLFNSLMLSGDINQMFLVNHHHSLRDSFANAQIVVLSEDGVIIPDGAYNEGVVIK